MLLKFPRESFLKHLEIVEKGLPVKPVMSITANILIKREKDTLSFMATNLDMAIKSSMDTADQLTGKENPTETFNDNGDEAKEEKVLVPQKLIEIIRHLPTGKEVSVEIDKDTRKIEITCGDSSFNLKGINSDEYPLIKEREPEKKPFIIKEKELKNIIRHTVFATSNDESRAAFTGVLFFMENEKLNIIASDTYRMVVEEREANFWDYDTNKFLVPAKSLRELQKILKDGEEEVMIYPLDNQLVFSFSHIYFITRLLQENYPDFRRVLPTQIMTKILVNRELFEDFILKASLVCDKESNAARITQKDMLMSVKASSEQGNMEDELTVIGKEGEDIDILLNVKFLADILKVIDSENVEIELSGKEAPCIIRPEGDLNFLYLVLPIKVEQHL